jgi:hypothetical protein
MIVNDLFESPQQCPECGGPAFGDLLLAEKKDACYSKVRSRYKVWPSAYASGALVQCRKKGAANWGNKSEGVAEGSLNEFAVSGDGGDGDDSLFNYAKMWYNGDLKTQRQVEKALQRQGLDIGENEDENGGAYISDISGDYYESWTAEDLEQGVAEGISVVKSDYDLDQMVLTLDIEGQRKQFTYWDYDEDFANAERRDVFDQLQQQSWYAGLDHPTKMEILDASYKAIRGEEPSEYKPTVDDEPLDEQGVAEGSFDYAKRGKELDASTKKIQANLDRRIRGKELDASVKNIQTDLDKRIKKTDKGVAEGSENNPVADAMFARLQQRPDLLRRHGVEYVIQAVHDVADSVGAVDEIGSSDVSGWMRQLEWNLKNKLNQYDEPMGDIDRLEEVRDEKIAGRHDPDEFDAMVGRLRQLAGEGPRKTVWDPVKRVYKTVPVTTSKTSPQN